MVDAAEELPSVFIWSSLFWQILFVGALLGATLLFVVYKLYRDRIRSDRLLATSQNGKNRRRSVANLASETIAATTTAEESPHCHNLSSPSRKRKYPETVEVTECSPSVVVAPSSNTGDNSNNNNTSSSNPFVSFNKKTSRTPSNSNLLGHSVEPTSSWTFVDMNTQEERKSPAEGVVEAEAEAHAAATTTAVEPESENEPEPESESKCSPPVSPDFDKANELKDAGNNLFKMQDYEGAEKNYLEALSLCPDSHNSFKSVLLNNVAAVKLMCKRSDEALDMVNRAVAEDETNSKAFLRRSKIYEEKGKYHDAVQDLKKACELNEAIAHTEKIRLAMLSHKSAELAEKEKEELISKAKDWGGKLLNKFGLSLDNFQVEKNPQTGSYNIQFKQGGTAKDDQDDKSSKD